MFGACFHSMADGCLVKRGCGDSVLGSGTCSEQCKIKQGLATSEEGLKINTSLAKYCLVWSMSGSLCTRLPASYTEPRSLDSDLLSPSSCSSFVTGFLLSLLHAFQLVGFGPHAAALHVGKLNVINEKRPNYSVSGC